MEKNILHITNGGSLTTYLNELDVFGDIITWQEMLCEGPTVEHIDSESFLNTRKVFLNKFYDVEIDEHEFKQELDKLNHIDNYNEIVLWFEYDLFCHINMIAVISLLQQRKIKLPISLVCSGRIKGEKDLKGLSELNTEQLLKHYNTRVTLLNEDLQLANTVWGVYCGKDHNLLKPLILQESSFKYLSNCLKAHLRRFPNSVNGLNSLEFNILKLIDNNDIKSKHHLLGYALNYQGYYGYGDMQMERLIEKLSIFFNEENKQISLNRKGHEAMHGHHNFSTELNNDLSFGGVKRLNYQYNRKQNKLVKTNVSAY